MTVQLAKSPAACMLIAMRTALIGSALMLVHFELLADDGQIDGTWLSADGDGWIDIRTVDGAPIGLIAGSPDDPMNLLPPRYDDKNPDPALRHRRLLGLQILAGFHRSGDNKWSGGTIYDPNSGKTYKCTLQLEDANRLRVRGFIGISLLGRTEIWTRREE